MVRLLKSIPLAMCVAIAACSKSGSANYDYAKIRKLALQSAAVADPVIGQNEYIILPAEALGESHKLIIYPEGISSYKTAIFQLSSTDMPGLAKNMHAMRHGAGNYSGDKYVGVWMDGGLTKLYPVSSETILPISKPEISREFVPELAIMALTSTKPVQGLQISDPARKAHADMLHYMSTQPDGEKLSKELDDLERIFRTTPLIRMDERRSDMGLGEQLLLMIWDDGYSDTSLENIDANFSQIIMASNFGDAPQLVSLPDTHQIRLHPGQTSGADSRVRQTQIALHGVIIPARTSAVLVRSE